MAMKLYAYIMLFLIGSKALAQDTKSKPASVGTATAQPAVIPYPNAPEITFTETEHDFGTVKKGQPVTYKFQYKNTGKEKLIISSCKAGCECTKVSCSKEAIKPGKTGFIIAHYDSTRVGKFGKEIMVYSNARKPVVFLIIKGVIEDPVVPANEQSPAEKHTE